ncbi:hypothetical protein MS3_00006401 [Schistosoma haematobium]|uniref:E2F-associated phosphoprotein n=3 Tax=Schistosoma haematobium TaxID=6185 RepID=A0A095AEM6_SCHHA|nr:hypothetical protein MS3_00006401 [Schistosoma haematobium]KAH9585001.1 hypothetical protein MS3_00006401 [Schistosoma haematobium]CAH8513380.1 unnamed protein product [Schistosoma haematobium]
MFSSDYDGCESDSSSSSDLCYDNRSVNAIEISKAKAMEFDELMNKELDLLIRSVHHKATDLKTGKKQNKNLRVRFKKDHDDGDDFPVDKDPLCDYEEDEANAKWVQENLPGGKSEKSDAILNCPGCMSVLSLVSHRHPHFKTQYYTEYPINCIVDETQIISRTISKPQNAKKSPESSLKSNRNVMKEYHPVTCKVCGNSVGCKEIQTNMIYFNDILASHS